MTRIEHHAVIVTSWNDALLIQAGGKAISLGLSVIGPGHVSINGYRTILVCPDGSKEGWGESDRCDVARREFCNWLNSQRYADGSTSLEWVEVAYGNDDQGASVESSAWSQS